MPAGPRKQRLKRRFHVRLLRKHHENSMPFVEGPRRTDPDPTSNRSQRRSSDVMQSWTDRGRLQKVEKDMGRKKPHKILWH